MLIIHSVWCVYIYSLQTAKATWPQLAADDVIQDETPEQYNAI
jgi:hypothetical protein